MNILERFLNISSLLVVFFPLMICLAIVCSKAATKINKSYEAPWLSGVSFCIMFFLGAGVLGSSMRRFAVIIGETQCP